MASITYTVSDCMLRFLQQKSTIISGNLCVCLIYWQSPDLIILYFA